MVLEYPCVPVLCVSLVSSCASDDTSHVDILQCASCQLGFFGLRDFGARVFVAKGSGH